MILIRFAISIFALTLLGMAFNLSATPGQSSTPPNALSAGAAITLR